MPTPSSATVNESGPVPTSNATLYTRPVRPPKLIVPALSPETAAWAERLGALADGSPTFRPPHDRRRVDIGVRCFRYSPLLGDKERKRVLNKVLEAIGR